MKRHELSKRQWDSLKDLFPPERKPQGGRPGKSNQEMLNEILYWLNTGIPWRDLPERFGPWQSVYSRFRAWTLAGVWEKVLTALMGQDIVEETTLMLDSTTIKVHQYASGVKRARLLPSAAQAASTQQAAVTAPVLAAATT
jgi:transposase